MTPDLGRYVTLESPRAGNDSIPESDLPIDVVTGGAGFIGSHLAEMLLEKGRRVRVVDDLSTGHRTNVPAGAEFLEGDVTDLAARAVRDADVVYHLAAIPSVPYSIQNPLDSHRSTVETTVAILAAAERARVRRVVFASSSAVYGDTPGLPRCEENETRALSPYAVGKLCGEMYARYWALKGSLETVSTRFFNVFGPRQDPRSPYAAVIPLFLERLRHDRPLEIFGDGRQTRDFTFVKDVALGLIAAGSAARPASSCYNIASGRQTPVLDLARAIAKEAGTPLRVEHLPPRPGDICHSWADVSRARRELGFSATISLEDGLRSTLAWFKPRERRGEVA
jgi:UDP-glucose 4-epimerase